MADPVWSPGDTALAFGSCQWGPIDELPAVSAVPDDRCYRSVDWTPDGRYLIVELTARGTGPTGQVGSATRTVAAYDLSEKQVIPLFDIAGLKSDASVSPNGRWIAYTSAETGTPEVYVRPFMASGRGVRLSTGGGRSPRWRGDGRELFYETADGRLMAMDLPAGGDVTRAWSRILFRAPGYARTMFYDRGTPYDVTPDGQRFVLRVSAAANHAVLVQHALATAAGR